MLALSVSPDRHRADPRDLPPEGSAWWLAYVKPRCERRVAAAFREADIAYYLPLGRFERFKRDSRYRGGMMKVRSVLPLFDGYLFLQGAFEDRMRALAVGRGSTVWIKPIEDQQTFASQLAELDAFLGCGLEAELTPTLHAGDRVRVTSGPLEGRTGTLTRIDHRARVQVNITILGRGVSVELDRCQIERVA